MLSAFCLSIAGPLAHAATIWTGTSIAVSKPAFADPNLVENQDRITATVWITRANTQGLYNAASESSFSPLASPAGTLWALGTTANFATLSFDTWNNTVGLGSPIGGPPNTIGRDFVVFLVDDDVYFDLRVTDWGVGAAGGGSFAYLRSTPPIPEPAPALLAALGPLAALRRRR